MTDTLKTSQLKPAGRQPALTNEPLPCEFADLGVTWVDPADQACGGPGSWLLVGPEDAPSPLCEKHAAMVRDRLHPLASYGVRLMQA